MKSLKVWLGCMLLATATGQAQAGYTILGAPACGEWVQERRSDGLPDTANSEWVLGYLSGMEYAGRVDFLKTVDNKSIDLWMDNYCKANPLESTHDGALKLRLELIAKMNKR